jgi:hypothetical protein
VLAALAVSAVAAGSVSASPGALRILLVEAQCDLNTPSVTLRNQLVAQPEVAAVDFFNGAAGTPSVGQLTPYDVVMAMGDCGWLDRIALGNNLADYQDQGGVVIVPPSTGRALAPAPSGAAGPMPVTPRTSPVLWTSRAQPPWVPVIRPARCSLASPACPRSTAARWR